MPSTSVIEAVCRLASRDRARTEADLQADIYLVLTSGHLALDPSQVARLEVPTGDGTRRRLDVEIGHCVIEIKRDLRRPGIKQEAESQLAGYVQAQSRRLGARYVGILTDGTDWYLYHLVSGLLKPVANLSLNTTSPDSEHLLVWLEAILTTQEAITPTPDEIQRRLGASSPGHLLDHASLSVLYDRASAVPEVQLKRQLWAKLLRTAFGKAFTDDKDLFVDHTLLVLTAEAIAHAVVGFDVSRTGSLTPVALAQGTVFAGSQIYGAVEADFFDWVLHVEGGPEFVADLADRVSRFDWNQVEHDVLKTLYESVIPQEDRANLGEYYTPDWLADRIVADVVTDPLSQRILDPACGSGTFLFHSIRAYLCAADESNISNGRAVAGVTQSICGMDVHPVAVTLARVTYLLAIGGERLAAPDRGPISIPVYLGDSVQWEQRNDLLGGVDHVRISTAGDELVDGGGMLFGDELVFPRSVLHDAGDFDRLVSAMADRAVLNSSRSSSDLVAPILRRFGIHADDVGTLTETFDTMRRLHRMGRNHIWGYYVRNLIRPLWLSEPAHRVDLLIGNPPWLRYSKMTEGMQRRYKDLSKDRGLLSGGLGASGRDLATLFVARSVELYLRTSGRFAFVMPHGTLTRKPHDGFRSGRWGSETAVTFDEPWDLENAPTGFPMVSCVVRGKRTAESTRRMPTTVQAWSARVGSPNVTWEDVREKFYITTKTVTALSSDNLPPASLYKRRFRNGAILYPRVFLFVNEVPSTPIGTGAGRIAVRSRRTSDEKRPWKNLESLQGIVERAFVRPVHLGESVLPFRTNQPLRAVLPVSDSGILSLSQIEDNPGLASWWTEVEELWSAHRVPRETSSLLERIDYHGQLSAQLPSARHRVLYSKSGNRLAAAWIDSPQVLIENRLYWAAVSSVSEARYLTAILNSTTVLDRVRPLQALGLFGGRDFDKNVFSVPIPVFEAEDVLHRQLVQFAVEGEAIAAQVDLSDVRSFTKARRLIREQLDASGLNRAIDEAVEKLVPLASVGLT